MFESPSIISKWFVVQLQSFFSTRVGRKLQFWWYFSLLQQRQAVFWPRKHSFINCGCNSVSSVYGGLVLIHVFFFCKGAVSAGGNVSVHGSAARPSRSVEPAGTQPVCSGHHGRGVGKGNCYIYCSRPVLTVQWKISLYHMSLHLKTVASEFRN